MNPNLPDHRDHEPVSGDNVPFDPAPWIPYKHVILWGYPHFAHALPPGTILVWQKKRGNEMGKFLSDGELAWMKGGKGVYIYEHRWNGFLRDSEQNTRTLHPTQKPVALMKFCIERLKLPAGTTILDPYMGAGSTGLAALDLGHPFIGIEIDEHHFATASDRINAKLRELAGLGEQLSLLQ